MSKMNNTTSKANDELEPPWLCPCPCPFSKLIISPPPNLELYLAYASKIKVFGYSLYIGVISLRRASTFPEDELKVQLKSLLFKEVKE